MNNNQQQHTTLSPTVNSSNAQTYNNKLHLIQPTSKPQLTPAEPTTTQLYISPLSHYNLSSSRPFASVASPKQQQQQQQTAFVSSSSPKTHHPPKNIRCCNNDDDDDDSDDDDDDDDEEMNIDEDDYGSDNHNQHANISIENNRTSNERIEIENKLMKMNISFITN